jgi:carboxypeptidase D
MVAILTAGSSSAQEEFPPEPYPGTDIYPAQVSLTTLDELQVLQQLEIDLEGIAPADGIRDSSTAFEPSIATIYINPTQADALKQAGLDPQPIPNEGYRSFLAYGPGSGAPNAWPTFTQYENRMLALVTAHPDIVVRTSIGQSVQGRPLYCLKITDNPALEENEPEFKYTANHHGDETTGVEMTMRLAELLANSYGVDPPLTGLVNEMEIWICPIYNPDGYVSGSRYNANWEDLNRDFPDRIDDPVDNPAGREPETQAFMYFGYDHRFSMGANYHGGAQVLNYPWDSIDYPPAEYAPDDQLFFDFGYGYTSRNSYLWNGGWDDGMTRGWEWYIIYGGMQDWAYYWHGEHHVTLEISDTKMPPFEQMNTYWEENRDAMIWWMQRARTGLSGLVLDAVDHTPLDATVTLTGWSVPPLNMILTDPQVGDYHRVIGEGTYTLTASAEGYISQSAVVNVISGTLTTTDFYLQPLSNLAFSDKSASTSQAVPQDVIEYQLFVKSAEDLPVSVVDTLPTSLTWTGYLTATQGLPVFAGGQITWQGEVNASQPVTITYAASVSECLPAGTHLINTAEFNDGIYAAVIRQADVLVTNAPPTAPASPSPADGGQFDPGVNTILTWSVSTDLNCDAITYDLYFGTIADPPLVQSGLTQPVYDAGFLAPGTTYYWYIAVRDGTTVTNGPIWSFSQGSDIRLFLPLLFGQAP